MATSQKATKKTSRAVRASAESADLLLEIGTEELPYQFIAPARRSLESAADTLLTEQRLAFHAIESFATPRRLALVVKGLAARQTTATKEAMGPPKSAAFDAAGQPTKAALGFAASQGVEVSALEVRELPKGAYLFAVKREEGRLARVVLQEHAGALIKGLSFPKAMKWNDTGFRFARPLRWIVALYGHHAIEFDVGGVRSGNRTYGHRVLAGKRASGGLVLKQASAYQQALEQAGVIVDPARRRALIERLLTGLAQRAKGQWRADEALLDQAVYAVEQPAAVLGSFEAKFLHLPPEVIETAMKEHQGFFSLRDAQGALLPNFLAVVNMVCRDMAPIRKGNERVLAARLADAAFYFGEDQKLPLAERAKKLDSVVFHQKLGTMGQKSHRLVELAGWLAETLGQASLGPTCRRAAQLCKADLLTGVVGEFPALQGVMGGVYAEKSGETSEVAAAIRDQYTPRGMDGKLPETRVGQIISLADRLDTVAAFFAAGLTPKGSEDPFALRRQALSIVRLVVEGGLRLDVAAALRRATESVKPHVKEAAKVVDDPLLFLLERFRFYVATTHRARADLIEAVTGGAAAAGAVDLVDLLERIHALQTIAGRPEFDPLIVGFKRAHRLVLKEKWTTAALEPEAFQHPAEKDLYVSLTEAQRVVPESIARVDYAGALAALVDLKPSIDAFFTGVMVNAEDQRLRANRLSLLYVIDELFARFADFSAVMEQGGAQA